MAKLPAFGEVRMLFEHLHLLQMGPSWAFQARCRVRQGHLHHQHVSRFLPCHPACCFLLATAPDMARLQAASQRDWQASHGACALRCTPGYHDPIPAHAGQVSLVAARDGSCRHCYPGWPSPSMQDLPHLYFPSPAASSPSRSCARLFHIQNNCNRLNHR